MIDRTLRILTLVTLAASLPARQAVPAAPSNDSILGFSPSHAVTEWETESRFQAIPSADRAREWHRLFTLNPHPAASPENNRLAEVVAKEWREQGWEDVKLRKYDVLHSEPRSVSLEMLQPIRFKASLREDAYAIDASTGNPRIDSAYFGYSASGDVTADVVYAHNGNPEDYDLLRKNGVTVNGKIVLVRYSNPYSYRGFKAITAEREGAAALLIYSDPADDGYGRGKVFPDGPWGPESHIQHGAITYDFIVPGDPTTPGWPSLAGARRVPRSEARSLPRIMALPLSWRDAKPLLERMTGPEVPESWRGGLPIKYRFTGSVTARVQVDMDTRIKPYTVVEARIRGAELPDEWVLVGNHRDAWVFGGVDPVSGTASMLELTRSLGELKKQGIRPRRTIITCSWDGEEYGLTGSTEWGEQFADDLRTKLVAYVNVDESVSGAATTAGPAGLRFAPSAVAALAPMLVEASKSVRVPSGKTLYESWRATSMRDDKLPAPPADASLVDTRIGSGSDHTVFLNHLGRPVINLNFGGDYGVYHSAYDDHFWMTNIGDPSFGYHIAMTQMWGVVTLRLANSDILPFDFGANGTALQGFLDTLKHDNRIEPKLQTRLRQLEDDIGQFQRAGARLRAVTLDSLASVQTTANRIQQLDAQLMQVESNWLVPGGIPGRPWFQHVLYAARYTYAHLELPGLTEAVESANWPLAAQQADILESAVRKNTQLLQAAASAWQASGQAPGRAQD